MQSRPPSCEHSRKGRNLLPSQKEGVEALWRQDTLGGIRRRQLKSALPRAFWARLEKPFRSPLSLLFVRTGQNTPRPEPAIRRPTDPAQRRNFEGEP
jgi:hypothetical protein